jgi:hypothetical protein
MVFEVYQQFIGNLMFSRYADKLLINCR